MRISYLLSLSAAVLLITPQRLAPPNPPGGLRAEASAKSCQVQSTIDFSNGLQGWTLKLGGGPKPVIKNGQLASQGPWPVDFNHVGGFGTGKCNVPSYGIGPFCHIVYKRLDNSDNRTCLDVRRSTATIWLRLDHVTIPKGSHLFLWVEMNDAVLKRNSSYAFTGKDLLSGIRKEAKGDTYDYNSAGEVSISLNLRDLFSSWTCFGANADYGQARWICKTEDSPNYGYVCAETYALFQEYLAHVNILFGFMLLLPREQFMQYSGEGTGNHLVGTGTILIRKIEFSAN
jgi:hypothetical protein